MLVTTYFLPANFPPFASPFRPFEILVYLEPRELKSWHISRQESGFETILVNIEHLKMPEI